MFVQDGFLYLIVTKHKLTVWQTRLPDPTADNTSVQNQAPQFQSGTRGSNVENPAKTQTSIG
jgi:hypothetical protein